MKRHCFALDLIADEELIAEYGQWHLAENGWSEVKESINKADTVDMEIYRTGNRLFMILEVTDGYWPEIKVTMDKTIPKVQEWGQLMWKFQQPLPWAKEGDKWGRCSAFSSCSERKF